MSCNIKRIIIDLESRISFIYSYANYTLWISCGVMRVCERTRLDTMADWYHCDML